MKTRISETLTVVSLQEQVLVSQKSIIQDQCHSHVTTRCIISRMEEYMSRNILVQARKTPEVPRPKIDLDWRSKVPVGSIVRLAEYDVEKGWHWRSYMVLRYYPYVVHCIDRNGLNRCFNNWEFRKRQKGMMDHPKGAASRWGDEIVSAHY